jgi:hypothetical protein
VGDTERQEARALGPLRDMSPRFGARVGESGIGLDYHVSV